MNEIPYISKRTIERMRKVQALLDQLDPEGQPRALVVPGSPRPRGDIIVFTGSFNPPTTAHIALMKQAQSFVRSRGPSHLYAAMSKHTVDKESVERPTQLDRIMLLQTLVRRRLSHAGVMLFNRGLYVEQAEGIRRSFSGIRRILFLIGFDKIVQILDPHYYDDRDASLHELFNLAELLVAPRGNAGEHELNELLEKPENRQFAHYIHALPFNPAYRDISSTHVRQEAGKGANMQDVPREVRQFMRETLAYAPPLRRDGKEIDYYGERMQYLQRLLRAPEKKIRIARGGR
jgi:nicotinic acid mononucleotide adenylyltransferase